jgi:hypothetical protein
MRLLIIAVLSAFAATAVVSVGQAQTDDLENPVLTPSLLDRPFPQLAPFI